MEKLLALEIRIYNSVSGLFIICHTAPNSIRCVDSDRPLGKSTETLSANLYWGSGKLLMCERIILANCVKWKFLSVAHKFIWTWMACDLGTISAWGKLPFSSPTVRMVSNLKWSFSNVNPQRWKGKYFRLSGSLIVKASRCDAYISAS